MDIHPPYIYVSSSPAPEIPGISAEVAGQLFDLSDAVTPDERLRAYRGIVFETRELLELFGVPEKAGYPKPKVDQNRWMILGDGEGGYFRGIWATEPDFFRHLAGLETLAPAEDFNATEPVDDDLSMDTDE